MKIAVYAPCYNEELMLPYFLRHYKQYTADITIYDNQSTDRSKDIAKASGCTLREFDSGNKARNDLRTNIKNNAWKEKRGKVDWVIVVDIDEFVYHTDLISILTISKNKDISVFYGKGYQMISEVEPNFIDSTKQLYETHKLGVLDSRYDKACIFNPNTLAEISYVDGCHKARPRMNKRLRLRKLNIDKSSLKFLHYTCFSWQYYWDKMQRLNARRSVADIKDKRGIHYEGSEACHRARFDGWLANAKEVI